MHFVFFYFSHAELKIPYFTLVFQHLVIFLLKPGIKVGESGGGGKQGRQNTWCPDWLGGLKSW